MDFSATVGYVDVGIISSRTVALKGRILEGVFDYPTYFLLSAIIMILSGLVSANFLGYSKNAKLISFNYIINYLHGLMTTFGLIFGEGINEEKIRRRKPGMIFSNA